MKNSSFFIPISLSTLFIGIFLYHLSFGESIEKSSAFSSPDYAVAVAKAEAEILAIKLSTEAQHHIFSIARPMTPQRFLVKDDLAESKVSSNENISQKLLKKHTQRSLNSEKEGTIPPSPSVSASEISSPLTDSLNSSTLTPIPNPPKQVAEPINTQPEQPITSPTLPPVVSVPDTTTKAS